MGARGRNANVTGRAPGKNTMANASTRARRAQAGEVVEGSPAFWDLVVSPERGGRRFWADPKDPGREAAWKTHRDGIMRRWYAQPHAHGRRPSAWWDFDFPEL